MSSIFNSSNIFTIIIHLSYSSMNLKILSQEVCEAAVSVVGEVVMLVGNG